MSSPVPICLFAYNRLHTLKQCVEALQKCKEAKHSVLYLFCDGIKSEKDRAAVTAVRSYLRSIQGFKKIEYNFSEKNIGVSASVINGITKTLEKHDKVIILEDDIVVCDTFLQYMNECLNFYSNHSQIFTISGFTIPIKLDPSYKYDVFAIPRTCSWGWGIWKEKWDKVDWTISDFDSFSHNKKDMQRFNEGGTDMYKMLWKQMNGKIDAWDIRISYQQFKEDAYTIYPAVSKANNIGFDSMASNCRGYNRYVTPLDTKVYSMFNLTENIVVERKILKQFQSFYSLRVRFIGRVKTEILFLKQRFGFAKN